MTLHEAARAAAESVFALPAVRTGDVERIAAAIVEHVGPLLRDLEEARKFAREADTIGQPDQWTTLACRVLRHLDMNELADNLDAEVPPLLASQELRERLAAAEVENEKLFAWLIHETGLGGDRQFHVPILEYQMRIGRFGGGRGINRWLFPTREAAISAVRAVMEKAK